MAEIYGNGLCDALPDPVVEGIPTKVVEWPNVERSVGWIRSPCRRDDLRRRNR